MKKLEAIRMVNGHLRGRVLNHGNTSFSNVNTAKSVWWLNIPPKKFINDLHILLAKKDGSGLIWLKIEANTFADIEEVFKIRNDKNVVDLEIACEGNRYMRDIKGGRTGYNFRRHIEQERDE